MKKKTVIKLTKEQYKRSLTARINHVWLYKRSETKQRTHNNSIFLTRTMGAPFACLVVEYEKCVCDKEIERLFGKGVFIDGAVSPDDKEKMMFECYYVKNL